VSQRAEQVLSGASERGTDQTLNRNQNGNHFFNTKSISQNPIEPAHPIKERATDTITYIFCKNFRSGLKS